MFNLIIFLLGFFGGVYVGQTYNIPRIEPLVRGLYRHATSGQQKEKRSNSADLSDDESVDVLHRDS